jgi:hypothetical protein
MRKLISIYIIILTSHFSFSQSCLPEGITFTRQSQIDSFQINYPYCSDIEGNVTISGNDIKNLNGLITLKRVTGILTIEDNPELMSLSGLDSLATIGVHFSTNHYALIIKNNPELIHLNGLANLMILGGGLFLDNNDILVNLTGLNRLTSIGGNLNIGHNYELASLTGLENLVSIGGSLIVNYWTNLADLCPLSNIATINGNIEISGSEICSLTGLEGLTLVNGDLKINDTRFLTDLTGLNNVIQIGGSLQIGAPQGPSSSLSNLEGLNNLISIDGDLKIYNNGDLLNLSGLNSLVSVGGHLTINGNDQLLSLQGLNSLNSIGKYLKIYENPLLSDITSLSSLNSIQGDLNIIQNNSLASLEGLQNINPATINVLRIFDNPQLNVCEIESICEYLISPNNTVAIYNNGNGCSNPAEIAHNCGITLPCLPYGNYYFMRQIDIDNFTLDYPDCNDLKGSVWIEGNDIEDLKGLNTISTIAGSLFIQYNTSLEDLSGLENLLSIGSYFMIQHNEALTALTGIDRLEPGTLTIFYIFHNPQLSYCHTQGVCEILISDIDVIGIDDNKVGCDSRSQVEAACGVGVEESAVGELQSAVVIFPNPSSKQISIELPKEPTGRTTLTIFNIGGQELLSCQIIDQNTRFDLASLPKGIYLVKVSSDDQVMVGKFVKQ